MFPLLALQKNKRRRGIRKEPKSRSDAKPSAPPATQSANQPNWRRLPAYVACKFIRHLTNSIRHVDTHFHHSQSQNLSGPFSVVIDSISISIEKKRRYYRRGDLEDPFFSDRFPAILHQNFAKFRQNFSDFSEI